MRSWCWLVCDLLCDVDSDGLHHWSFIIFVKCCERKEMKLFCTLNYKVYVMCQKWCQDFGCGRHREGCIINVKNYADRQHYYYASNELIIKNILNLWSFNWLQLFAFWPFQKFEWTNHWMRALLNHSLCIHIKMLCYSYTMN